MLMVLKNVMKKKHAQKFDVRSDVTQELKETGVHFNKSAMRI